jgi:NitT/TauT family transport system ATP-binding protein
MLQSAGGATLESDRIEATTAVSDRRETASGGSAPGVSVDHVTHWFVRQGDVHCVLNDVSFEVPDGQFVALVGASGCGKTTLLNIFAGLIRPAEGNVRVFVHGEEVTVPSPKVGYMWARDSLLPWRTLQRNVEFGLEVRNVGRKERAVRAAECINLVGLAGAEGRYPRQLSQGMRQRGNLARLLASEPDLYLMDEPFSAVDAQTKVVLQDEFLKIWHQRRRTTVYVTHDLDEAALLADRVIVMAPRVIMFDVTVPFERPRDVKTLRFSSEFREFSHELWAMLETAKGTLRD